MRRVVFAALVFIAVGVVADYAWVRTHRLEFECLDKILQEADSVDGSLRATLFSRDCGATTGDNRQVNLRARVDGFDSRRGTVFVVDGAGDVAVAWTSPRVLQITHERGPVVRADTSWDAVEIVYLEREPHTR